MEPVSLWAAVEFTACNGSTEALLTAAARAGLHPYGVTALPGGFGGGGAAGAKRSFCWPPTIRRPFRSWGGG